MYARLVLPLLALVLLAFACSDDEEQAVSDDVTETPATRSAASTPEPRNSNSADIAEVPTLGAEIPTPTSAVVPTLIPTEIPTPVWLTAIDVSGDFTLQYPAGWFAQPETGRLANFNILTWDARSLYPDGGILVEYRRLPLEGLDPRPSGATEASLGGVSGWQWVIHVTDEEAEADWRFKRVITVERDGYRYSISAAFKEPDPDEALFLEIAGTFEFTR